jgi:arylsulfatase A-like enzyme
MTKITIALLSVLLAISSATAAEKSRPNILFIFSDDHAWQAISAYGDARKLNSTPNIDRLAKEGIRFDRCLVPNSICGPSRACVLTGKYNHLNGFYNNTNCKFDGSQQTFPKLLQAAGYQTAIVGKWHLMSDPTGFDYWEVLNGQGVYYNPPMVRNGERVKHEGYVTDIITDNSIDWLKKRDKSRPFLLMCQHKAPHREWSPALRHLNFDKDREYALPDTLFDDYSGRGAAERGQDMTIEKTMTPFDCKLTPLQGLNPEQLKEWNAYYEPRNENFRAANLSGKELIKWKYNRYMHDYLACVQAVDENVGRLLKYLDDEGLADNTIVVYSSDQGFFLGEHGWFDKRWIFEESLRTPLLVRWPGHTKPGTTSKDIVSNIDFAGTFLEAAGLSIPTDLQGHSMVPVLEGKTPADWRKSFYYQYYEYPAPHRVRPHYGVVTDRYKLVYLEPFGEEQGYWELFDLEKDPHEMKSVYGQADYEGTQTELKNELGRLRSELKVPETTDPKAYGNDRPAARKKAGAVR